eukprot:COSAG03_NODE_12323_length_552_cov_0.847682_1_plen_101_part_00
MKFADGTVDDWETEDFAAHQPADRSPARQESPLDESGDEKGEGKANRDMAASPVIEDDPFAELDAIVSGEHGDAISDDTDTDDGDGDVDPYDMLESLLNG